MVDVPRVKVVEVTLQASVGGDFTYHSTYSWRLLDGNKATREDMRQSVVEHNQDILCAAYLTNESWTCSILLSL